MSLLFSTPPPFQFGLGGYGPDDGSGGGAAGGGAFATAGSAGPSLDLNFINGTPIDPRISFTRASTANYFDSTGTLQSAAANVPRLDYGANPGSAPLGLLIEEQRTNGIRNPRCEGAAVGTPGTMPTDWFPINWGGGVGNMTINLVATGNESGLAYCDFAVSGTANLTTSLGLLFEQTTLIAATSGQTWTASAYFRVVAGTVPAGTVYLAQKERASNGSSLVEGSVDAAPTTAPLATQRVILTRTLTGGTTAYLASAIEVNVTTGITYSFTFRVGAPQLELGSFATSLMLPTAGSPAASTRAVDLASMPLGSWYSRTGPGSWVANAIEPQAATAAFGRLFSANDGTITNCNEMWFNSGAQMIGSVTVAGVGVSVTAGNVPIASPFKAGISISGNTFAASINGTTPIVSAAGAYPGVATQLNLGNRADGTRSTSSYISRVRYWPRALSNTELQRATT